jgi:hypothetical protein
MKDGLELLTKANARAGVRVVFRGEERVIDDVAEGEMGGVWLKPVTEKEARDFLYFSEAASFNVTVVPDGESSAVAAVAVHDVVQIRPDAPSDFRGCLAIVTAEAEGHRDAVVVEIVLPVQGPGAARILRGHVFERGELRRVGVAHFLPGADPFPREGAAAADVTWTVNVPD